ncbi:hypothetical protein ACIBQ1_39450 [Nonomuraea sp. NPDC050153]|uniref:hypothetical protein n=1 Tax=Nonomuraea sp. NPDC050153 TaxID=3364359 RepID=UPI0037B46CE6
MRVADPRFRHHGRRVRCSGLPVVARRCFSRLRGGVGASSADGSADGSAAGSAVTACTRLVTCPPRRAATFGAALMPATRRRSSHRPG